MHFCVYCGSLLLIESAPNGGSRFCCPTCPFVHNISKTIVAKAAIKKKVVDDILGGSSAWDNVDRTEGRCKSLKNCKHVKARHFFPLLIISRLLALP